MWKKFINSTTDLLDKKLKNGTVMVVIISILVTLSWFLTNPVNANLTANVIQSQNKSIEINQYIVIAGKKYKIVLEEVK